MFAPFLFSVIMRDVNGKINSVNAQQRDVTTRSRLRWFLCRTTLKFNLQYVAPLFCVVNYIPISTGIKYYGYAFFALIISRTKCILTSKFHPVENQSLFNIMRMLYRFNYAACKSNLLCAILYSMIYGLSALPYFS